ncbi:MAG: sigma-70 family RNA polymerase sigma factor [Oscillospiraceae bacterium]|nr:sigma-70 family RNA polymerase sigma factor [Oscillospiraceae bacterium]
MGNNTKQYINILTDEYLKPFYAFAVSRTNNAYEAEELAQEITYQCVVALNKSNEIDNLNAFLWSVAHNTYKRRLYKKNNARMTSLDDNADYINNIVDISPRSNIEDLLVKSEDMRQIRKELAIMSNFYRKVLVCFYYDSLTIPEIGKKLGLSVEMVKFYLQNGRKKLKEAYNMSKDYTNLGEKSFNPSPFTVFRGTLDFCSVDVWQIFKRKLPCQIALVCYDSPKTIDEICLETGVPAAYIEEELQILVDSELIISPVKDKYRTNFFILRNNALKQLKEQFIKMYSKYVSIVIKTFEKYLPEMKECDIFKFDAKDSRYAWVFHSVVTDFAGTDLNMNTDDYITLADGVKGLVYAQEEAAFKNMQNHSGVYSEKDNITIHASSSSAQYPRVERELVGEAKVNKNFRNISALYDIYKDTMNDNDKEIYAWLLEQGYAFKENGKIICDVAVHTAKSKELFNKINSELEVVLAPLCKEIYENISRIVASTIPPQLKQHTHGYTSFEIQHYAGIFFREALYNKGFVTIPEDSDKTPVSCWIDEM